MNALGEEDYRVCVCVCVCACVCACRTYEEMDLKALKILPLRDEVSKCGSQK